MISDIVIETILTHLQYFLAEQINALLNELTDTLEDIINEWLPFVVGEERTKIQDRAANLENEAQLIDQMLLKEEDITMR